MTTRARPGAGASALGQQLQAAFGLHAQGRVEEAQAAATRILKIAPKEPNALYLLGIIAHQAGDPKSAAQHFEKSYKADRNSVAALSGLGIVRLDQKRYGEAKGLFAKALQLQADDAMLLNNLGLAQKGAGDLTAALESFRAALRAKPDYLTAAFNMGETLMLLGREGEAEQIYREGLRRDPRAPEFNNALAGILASRNRIDEALARLEVAAGEPGGDAPDILQNLASLLINKNRLEEAEAALRRGLERHPNSIVLRIDLADVLKARGDAARLAEAEALYADVAESVADGRAPAEDSAMALHRIAKALDATKRYDAAFRFHSRAQAAWKAQAARRGQRYEPAETERLVAETQRVFEALPAPLPPPRPDGPDDPGGASASDRPIFILGMPRSGTSLAEQILASHPDVYGCGELTVIPELVAAAEEETGAAWPEAAARLTAERRADLAGRYLAALPEAARGARHTVDKLPPNFWYLGFIRLLFPKATIIHTLRHPIDTCFSIFTQRFSQDLLFDHDLGDLAHYYRQYRAIMAFWEGWEPDLIPLAYERMVADQAGETRRLLARLTLAWDARVLAFHETEREVLTASRLQVRQPIYTSSVAKWRRYEAGLAPLVEALGPLADYESYLAAREA